MKIRRIIAQAFIFGFVLTMTSTVFGQQVTEEEQMNAIKLTSRTFGDSIVLRWAPEDFKVWELGNKYGYRVSRRTYAKGGQRLSAEERRASNKEFEMLFKVAPEEKWEKLMEKDDRFGIAGLALFGEDFTVNDPTASDAVTFYHQSKEQESRYGFGLFAADQSLEVAKAMGLSMTDRNVSLDEEYIYSVRIASNLENIEVEPGLVKIATADVTALPRPEIIDSDFKDGSVQLVWKRLDKEYTTYNVQRSSDGGKTFEQVNDKPIIFSAGSESKQILYMAELPANNVSYQFRVLGNTIYDQVSPPSNIIEGMGLPAALKARPHIVDVFEMEDKKIQVRWKFDEKLNPKIKGFDLYKTKVFEGEEVKVNEEFIAADIRVFVDESPSATNYYILKAIDENGHVLPSVKQLAQLEDHTPPMQPLGLQGKLDEEDGTVYLNWNPNTDEDLRGYRVFFSNNGDGDFIQVTSRAVEDTIFSYQVTMNTLSEKVYFKVLAIDYHDNFSEMSEVCIVQRPDTRPPSAPAFISLKASKKGVKLNWASSSSEDVVGHRLQRRVKSGGDWETIFSYEENQSLVGFIDTTASNRLIYEYSVVATDDAGLEGSSSILEATPTDDFVRAGIQDVKITAIRRSKIIKVSWIYNNVNAVDEFVIYRAKKDNLISTYKVIDAAEVKIADASIPDLNGRIYFDDRNVEKGQEYTYQILAKHKDGGYSPLTEAVVRKFN